MNTLARLLLSSGLKHTQWATYWSAGSQNTSYFTGPYYDYRYSFPWVSETRQTFVAIARQVNGHYTTYATQVTTTATTWRWTTW